MTDNLRLSIISKHDSVVTIASSKERTRVFLDNGKYPVTYLDFDTEDVKGICTKILKHLDTPSENQS